MAFRETCGTLDFRYTRQFDKSEMMDNKVTASLIYPSTCRPKVAFSFEKNFLLLLFYRNVSLSRVINKYAVAAKNITSCTVRVRRASRFCSRPFSVVLSMRHGGKCQPMTFSSVKGTSFHLLCSSQLSDHLPNPV